MHKTTRHAIRETISQAIDDLYALAKEADSEDAEQIYESAQSLVLRAREAGQAITADVYPYRYWMSGITALVTSRD